MKILSPGEKEENTKTKKILPAMDETLCSIQRGIHPIISWSNI